LAAVGKHDTAIACAIDIGIDETAVLSRERDVVLSGGEGRNRDDSDH
jgi:hypothetical protein